MKKPLLRETTQNHTQTHTKSQSKSLYSPIRILIHNIH